MKKKFDESFKEYICENPTEIFEHMKNARFAGELFDESGDLPFPFTLSMSIGAVEFSLEDHHASLTDLLSLADDKLYIEKKEKHKKK